MEPFEKIQLAFKCPKALNELNPCNSNWYCDSCEKMVYDFRGMTEEDILDTFAKSGQKLCGIYDADRIKVMPQKSKWYKLVPAAMLMTGLAACNQQPKPNKLSYVGMISRPTVITHHHTLGEPLIAPSKSKERTKVKFMHPVKFPAPKVLVGDVVVSESEPDVTPTDTINQPGAIKIDDLKTDVDVTLVCGVETDPSYPGGSAAFIKYLHQHINYSGEYTGRVYTCFRINKNGSLSDVKIIRGGTPELNQKIITVIENSPRWSPAIQNGEKAAFEYTVPINFMVSN